MVIFATLTDGVDGCCAYPCFVFGSEPARSAVGFGGEAARPARFVETPRPGNLSRPNPTADLAGALPRGTKHG